MSKLGADPATLRRLASAFDRASESLDPAAAFDALVEALS